MQRWLDSVSQNRKWGRVINVMAILFFLFFIISPLFFVFTNIGSFEFSAAMQEALITSFGIAALVTFIDLIFGIPLAWLLARKRFPLIGVVDALIDLPLIIPTSALGLSIALFWGSMGLGLIQPGLLLIVVLHIAFTFSYVVRTTQAAILEMNGDLARAASSLGASPLLSFRTIWMPLMRAGRILQAGTPHEVYLHPNCPFVASFLGEANFLRVNFDDGEAQLLGQKVKTKLHGAYIACIRPENMRLDHKGTKVRVTNCRPFGPFFKYDVDFNGLTLSVRTTHDQRDATFLSFDPAEVLYFKEPDEGLEKSLASA